MKFLNKFKIKIGDRVYFDSIYDELKGIYLVTGKKSDHFYLYNESGDYRKAAHYTEVKKVINDVFIRWYFKRCACRG